MILSIRWGLDLFGFTKKYDYHRLHRQRRRELINFPSKYNERLNHMLRELYRLRYAVAIGRHGNRAICFSLNERGVKRLWEILEYRFKTWPKYSGNPNFPVPCITHPDSQWEADQSYQRSNRTAAMWSGPYGEQRVELLDHIIADVERDVFGVQPLCKK